MEPSGNQKDASTEEPLHAAGGEISHGARLQEAVDPGPIELRQALEAMIFAADAPVSVSELQVAYTRVTGHEIDDEALEAALDALNAGYESSEAAFRIERWAGGVRMATRPALAPFLRTLRDEQQRVSLSRSLLETLAIVAYRQPVTKPEVDALRGVDAGYALGRLLELKLLDIVGKSESVGRPLLYGTTSHFLDTFGLDDLDTLPTLREVEELLSDPAFSREKARLLALGPPGEEADADLSRSDHVPPASS